MMNTEPIPTRVGLAGWTDHRHFGMSVFNELAGRTTTTGLIVLAATGRRLEEDDCSILDDIAVILTVADPRIYPLKLVRLATAFGDPLAGIAAAVTAMQGALVGPRIAQDTAQWLVGLASDLGERVSQKSEIRSAFKKLIEEKGRLAGFGVPFRPEDERGVALTQRVKDRKRDTGTYWQLQETVADYLKETKGIPANVGLPVAALSLDMGLKPENLAALYTGLTINVFLANAVEGAEQAPQLLRCLLESTVEYIGRGPRDTKQETPG